MGGEEFRQRHIAPFPFLPALQGRRSVPRRRRPFPDTGPSGVAGAACCPAGFSALLNGSCRRCACGVPRETSPAVGDEGVLGLVVLDFGGEVRRALLAVERLLTLPGAVSARLAVVDKPALSEFISPPFQNRCQVPSHPSGYSDGSSRRAVVVARNSGRAKCATGLRIWLRGNSTRARALRFRPPHHADARHRAPRHGRSRAGSPAFRPGRLQLRRAQAEALLLLAPAGATAPERRPARCRCWSLRSSSRVSPALEAAG